MSDITANQTAAIQDVRESRTAGATFQQALRSVREAVGLLRVPVAAGPIESRDLIKFQRSSDVVAWQRRDR
jgi:hypothetical protein